MTLFFSRRLPSNVWPCTSFYSLGSMSRLLLTWSIAILSPNIARAETDPSTIIVPYSSSGSRTLGDAVNIVFPYTPVGRCVSYSPTDIFWDTGGSLFSDGKISIESGEDEDKSTTNISLGYQSSGKVKAGVFNANSSFDLDSTLNLLRSSDLKTTTLAFTAKANYGRRMIESYKLDTTVPSPTTDLSGFRERCGSHFIRGERRDSDLKIYVRLTSTSREGKDAVVAHLKQTIGGSVGLKGLSGEAGSTFKASYENIVEFVKKTGSVTIDYQAHGGTGIAAAGAAAKLVDPSDFGKLSDIVANVSSQFTQENSSITGYVLQSNSTIGAPNIEFDLDRVERIGVLTRNLIILNDISSRYDDMKSHYPAVYAQYYQKYADQVDLVRSQAVEQIKKCAAGGDCSPLKNDIAQNLLFLENMFSKAEITLSCHYQHAKTLLPTVSTPSSDPEVLENVSINIEGTSHNPKLIDFSNVGVVRLRSDNTIEDLTNRFSGLSVSPSDANGESRAFGSVYSENINPATAIKYDNSSQEFIIDSGELGRRRELILSSAYSMSAPGPNNLKASFDVGFPPRDNCPVVK